MKLSKSLVIAAVALMCAATGTVSAQNNSNRGNNGGDQRGGDQGGRRGGFDPAAMQQRMMDNVKEQMGVTDDGEWKVIQERIQKVMDARRDVGFGGASRMFSRRSSDSNRSGDNRGRGGMFGSPSPEQEALQKAIDNNAPDAQVKAALEKYRAAQKAKEAALEKAQANLKSVLTPKQEAIAVADGLLK